MAIDGTRVDANSVGARLRDHRPGQTVRVTFFRRNVLMSVDVALRINPYRSFKFARDPRAAGVRRAIVRGWLGPERTKPRAGSRSR